MRTKIITLFLLLFASSGFAQTVQITSADALSIAQNQFKGHEQNIQTDENEVFLISQCPGDVNYFFGGGIIDTIESFELEGAIDKKDIAVLWLNSYKGSLIVLNLFETTFLIDGVNDFTIGYLPDYSFFHPEEQVDCESLTLSPIQLEKLIMSAYVTSIGKYAFAFAANLSEVKFSNANGRMGSVILETIGEGAFLGCVKLKKLELYDGLLEIGAFAFKDCRALDYIYLPESLETIGDNCFKGCVGITNIYCQAAVPPQCQAIDEDGNGTFAGVPTDVEVFVPAGTKELYEAAPGWSQFTNIQEYEYASDESVMAVEVDSSAPCDVYNLSGVRVGGSTDGLDAGLYLVRQGDKVKKVAVK